MGDGAAEAEGAYVYGDPGELVGDADDAFYFVSYWGVLVFLKDGSGGETYFCSHDQSCPAPMKLAPKQRPLINEVVRTATHGILRLVNLAKKLGAYPSVARV